MLERTEWRPGEQLPDWCGVYERVVENVYAYWDGAHWYGFGYTPAEAEADYRDAVAFGEKPAQLADIQWRGLTREAHDAEMARLRGPVIATVTPPYPDGSTTLHSNSA